MKLFNSNDISKRFSSDEGAVGSTEMVMLIAVAIFIILAIYKYIVTPVVKKSEDIGKAIQGM